MAENEAKIKISADIKELKREVTEANSHIKSMRSELKLNEAQFKNTGDKTEYLQKKHATLSSMLEENANKQNALNKQLELAQQAEDTTQIEKLKISLTYASIEEENLKTKISECDAELERQKQASAALDTPFEKLNNTIKVQKNELDGLKTEYKNVALEQGTDSKEAKELKSKINSLNSELKKNEQELRKVENAAESTGKKMKDSANGGWSVFKGVVSNVTTNVIRGAGSAVKNFIDDSIETSKGFDTAMSQVAATMGTTVDSISDMKDKAAEMGATTEWTATQSAEAMNYLALAGYSSAQSCSTLPTVLNLASAAGMDLSDASDMVTDAMTALGIKADKEGKNITGFGDKMAKTASKSNTSVSQLGNAILTVGGTAKMLSGGTTELNAALGILADNSIKGSEGGTKLRNIILAMKPTTDKAAAGWEELGVSAYDAQGQLRPLEDTFADLNQAMAGMSDEKKTELLKNMFNKADLAAVNALLATSSDRWHELSVAIDGSWYSIETLSTDLSNAGLSLEQMRSNMENLGVSSDDFNSILTNCGGDADLFADVLLEVSKKGTAFDDIVNALGGDLEPLGEVFEATKGAMAEMAATQLDNLEGDLTLMDSAIDGLKKNIGDELEPTMRSAAQFVTNNVIPAITESMQWMKEHKGVIATVASVIAILATAYTAFSIVQGVKTAMDAAETASLGALIAAKLASAAASAAALAPYILVVAAIAAVIAIIVLCVKHWDQIKAKTTEVANSVGEKVTLIKEKVVGTFQNVLAWIKKNWLGLSLLIVNPFAGAFKLAYDNCEGFRTKVDTIFTSIKTRASTIFNSIKDAITHPIQTAKNIISNIVESIKSTFEKLHINLPHIKLPHFNISGGKAPYGLGGKGTAPSFKIDWYAKGAVFSKPTLLSHVNGLAGVGEAGPEAVAPISVLKQYVQDAVDVSMSNMVIIDYIQLARAMAQLKTVIELDHREFARAVRSVD